MLVFVTSLRHPDNASDYRFTEELLSETLRSISQQTSEQYRVVIVGNRKPSFSLPDRTQFVRVDFPAPSKVNGVHANRDGFVRDKGSKIGVGLVAARQHSPDWVMIFDADDFVHRELVEFVESRPDAAGWYVDRGLIYSRSRNGYRRQDEFHHVCGTSYIIPYSAYEVPVDLSVNAAQAAVISAFGEVLPNVMGAHREADSWFAKHGRVLQPIPFRAAVYQVDTGENHSRHALPGVIKPHDSRLARDFAIASRSSRARTYWRSYGPEGPLRALWIRVKRVVGPYYRRLRRLG